MPLSPMDEFLAHQTPETFDRVYTSDRNFYDRHYFNLHPSSDELFLIMGMGQYPNLGTTDAFVSISHDHLHTVVRASRELGSDRMDTQVGPLRIEVVEGLKKMRLVCEPNEWGVAFDLVFDGAGPALEEPHTFQRMDHGRVQMDTSRYSQVGCWTGALEVGGKRHDVTPDRWKGVRDHSWGVRPVGEAEPPGIRVKAMAKGVGFFHTWMPMHFDDFLLKIFVDEDRDGKRLIEESMRIDHFAAGGAVHAMGSPKIHFDYRSGTREITGARIDLSDPDGKPLRVRATPLRTLYLAAGSGYVPQPDWAHGMYHGELVVQGHRYELGTPEQRAKYGPLYETLSRYELSTGEVGYGLLENLIIGTYRPHGFESPGAMAP